MRIGKRFWMLLGLSAILLSWQSLGLIEQGFAGDGAVAAGPAWPVGNPGQVLRPGSKTAGKSAPARSPSAPAQPNAPTAQPPIQTLAKTVAPPRTQVANGVFSVKDYGAAGNGITDDSPAVMAAISACYNAGGGTVYFPAGRYLINSQITFPDNYDARQPTQPPFQPPMRLAGDGCHKVAVGAGKTIEPSAGTILDLRYGNNAEFAPKIWTRGFGFLEITDMTLTDLGTSANPFLLTTNTTLHVRNVTAWGNAAKTLNYCDQDFIVLGGTQARSNPDWGVTPNSPFQGYGTIIEGCYMNRMRRLVLGQTYCNGVIIRDNTVWANSGSGLVDGACIEISGYDANGAPCAGNVIANNLIELGGYPYGIKLVNALSNSVLNNNFYDYEGGRFARAMIYLAETAHKNTIICGNGDSTKISSGKHVYNADPHGSNTNLIINGSPGQHRFDTGDFLWDTGFAGNNWRLQAYTVTLSDHINNVHNRHVTFMGNLGMPLALENNYDIIALGVSQDTLIGRKRAGTVKIGNSYAGVKKTQTRAADGAVSIDASSGMVQVIVLGANVTGSAISNGVEAQTLTVIWRQDAAGGRTYAWPANCKFANGTPPSASTMGGYQDSVTFVYDGSDWLEISRAPAIH